MLGKYAAENGFTCVVSHYSAVWGISINESKKAKGKAEQLVEWSSQLLLGELLKESFLFVTFPSFL